VDLLEAEGRLLRRTVMRAGVGLAMVAVAALLVFGGLAFCLWAVYQGLVAQLGPVNAALVVGVLMLLLAGLMAWIAIRLSR
jgi:hypothetical protein